MSAFRDGLRPSRKLRERSEDVCLDPGCTRARAHCLQPRRELGVRLWLIALARGSVDERIDDDVAVPELLAVEPGSARELPLEPRVQTSDLRLRRGEHAVRELSFGPLEKHDLG